MAGLIVDNSKKESVGKSILRQRFTSDSSGSVCNNIDHSSTMVPLAHSNGHKGLFFPELDKKCQPMTRFESKEYGAFIVDSQSTADSQSTVDININASEPDDGMEMFQLDERQTLLTSEELQSKFTIDDHKDRLEIKYIHLDEETSWIFFLQVIFPFLIAGGGMVAAGLLFDLVQHWSLFVQVPEVFILVPALLGLKGNLEMTLASRLSTLANTGQMDSFEQRLRVIGSNLALIQAQASVVAILASLFAVALTWVPRGQVDWTHAVMLFASSVTTASLASLILGLAVVGVVLWSRAMGINPDNVATPIAASLGDLITLTLLSFFGSFFLDARKTDSSSSLVVVVGFTSAIPGWMWLASKETGAANVLRHGWAPVIFAMLISSSGGFILKLAVRRFHGIAVFQPVINGIGGNIAAIQASRISTFLHQSSRLGHLPRGQTSNYCSIYRAFLSTDLDATAARVLLLMLIPSHLIFNFTIHLFRAGHTTITPLFTLFYMSAAFLQVFILLYVCQWMIRRMWRWSIDPDNSAIPYLTAMGDLLGSGLLALAFVILYTLGDRDSDIGE